MIRCTDVDISTYLKKKIYNINTLKSIECINVICEPDLIALVSDCIVKHSEGKQRQTSFSVQNIIDSKYSTDNVLGAFKKPDLTPVKQKAEYVKAYKAPMEFLAYIGVLTKVKEETYKVSDKEMLELFSIKVRNCFRMINVHTYKIIKDSGINKPFDLYFINPNEQNYNKMKTAFADCLKKAVKITLPNDVNKLFQKVLNVLAFPKKAYGTIKGKMMKSPVTYDMLMYHHNYYDGSGSKTEQVEIYRKYATRRAKNFILRCNELYRDGKTEVYQKGQIKEKGTAAHHIFPEGKFPQLAEYYENQIILTNDQHLRLAHPDGDTQVTDSKYQRVCLFAKIDTIKESIEKNEGLYLFSNLIKVLSIGLNTDSFKDVKQLDFDEVKFRVAKFYGNM